MDDTSGLTLMDQRYFYTMFALLRNTKDIAVGAVVLEFDSRAAQGGQIAHSTANGLPSLRRSFGVRSGVVQGLSCGNEPRH